MEYVPGVVTNCFVSLLKCYFGIYFLNLEFISHCVTTQTINTKITLLWTHIEFTTPIHTLFHISWWRHQMETVSALLAICAGNSPVPGEFPAQRPATRSFDVFFDLRLNERLGKQSWGWWFETLLLPLWHHCNVNITNYGMKNMKHFRGLYRYVRLATFLFKTWVVQH